MGWGEDWQAPHPHSGCDSQELILSTKLWARHSPGGPSLAEKNHQRESIGIAAGLHALADSSQALGPSLSQG